MVATETSQTHPRMNEANETSIYRYRFRHITTKHTPALAPINNLRGNMTRNNQIRFSWHFVLNLLHVIGQINYQSWPDHPEGS